MSSTTLTVAGHPMAVDVSGPDRGNHVVLLGAVTAPRDAYAALCARLHNAALRTVVISTDASLRTSHVMGVLDAVGVRFAHSPGCGEAVHAVCVIDDDGIRHVDRLH